MITDPQFFVGRREELDFITSRLVNTQPTSINVVGERRIGKSSLLYHFFQTYEQRVQGAGKNPGDYVVVYLSLQAAQCRQENSFYQAVAQALLNRPVVQTNPVLVTPLQGVILDRQSFSAAIEAWQAENVLPVLCLDKFEELLAKPDEFTDDFYDNLRSLMDRNALMLVIASYKNLDVYKRKYRFISSFFNLGQVLPVGGITETEATDLMRLPPPAKLSRILPQFLEISQSVRASDNGTSSYRQFELLQSPITALEQLRNTLAYSQNPELATGFGRIAQQWLKILQTAQKTLEEQAKRSAEIPQVYIAGASLNPDDAKTFCATFYNIAANGFFYSVVPIL